MPIPTVSSVPGTDRPPGASFVPPLATPGEGLCQRIVQSTATAVGAQPLDRHVCRLVRELACEMFTLIGGQTERRNRRHAMNHIRQIAIYVCHVGLSMPVAIVAQCFGRDAATVRNTCLLIEERREAAGFDDFVAAIERVAASVFLLAKGEGDDDTH